MSDFHADVVVAAPIDNTLRYRTAEFLPPGSLVSVPLGRRSALGVVWYEVRGGIPKGMSFKHIHTAYTNHPPVPLAWMQFLTRLASYYVAPLGRALKTALPVSEQQLQSKTMRILTSCNIDPTPDATAALSRSPKLRSLIESLSQHPKRSDSEWRLAGFTTAIINRTTRLGLARWTHQPSPLWSPSRLDVDFLPAKLNDEQDAGFQALLNALNASRFSTVVIDGVTGSGKTEIYLEAIAHCLKQGKQALVLMPEIGLTAAWLQRCQNRFGGPPVLWHSQLTSSQRKKHWLSVANHTASLVVGARSALFLPFNSLGLIVVDEEHDPSYKNHDGLPYQARDMAVMRAHMDNSVCTLVSATPSLETVFNIKNQRYQHVVLTRQYSGLASPQISLIDQVPRARQSSPTNTAKNDKPSENDQTGALSPRLRQAIDTCLTSSQQVLLYINRRGYAPLTICRSCGKRLLCPHCDQALVFHKQHQRWMCHVCGYEHIRMEHCPYCMKRGGLVDFGVGAEKLYEEVQELWPKAKTRLITSDHIRGMAEFQELIHDVADRKIDILIGTQMLAKGYHFPNLQLVGIVEGDGANAADFRLGERQFQLLQQVAGRAGRSIERGQVLIQCFNPQSPVLKAIADQNRAAFVQEELEVRKAFSWPPYSRLMAINVQGTKRDDVSALAHQIRTAAPERKGFRVLGPAPALVPRIRSVWRYRLLLIMQHGSGTLLTRQDYWRLWNSQFITPSRILVRVDMDPYHFD